VFDGWFEPDEHGAAWGIAGTSGRGGIILTGLALYGSSRSI
jgi:hypothetical protein